MNQRINVKGMGRISLSPASIANTPKYIQSGWELRAIDTIRQRRKPPEIKFTVYVVDQCVHIRRDDDVTEFLKTHAVCTGLSHKVAKVMQSQIIEKIKNNLHA